MRKLHTLIRTAALTGIFVLGTANLTWASGWKQDGTGWWYEKEDGSYPAGAWYSVQGVWYYFDANGYMQTGWLQQGTDWYYLDSSGAMLENETREIDGTVYTFGADGKMAASASADASGNDNVNSGGNSSENSGVNNSVNSSTNSSAINSAEARQQAEQWFYASYAIIANENDWNAKYFVSTLGVYEREARYRLERAWGITDRASALETIQNLNEGMHRIWYQVEMAIYEYIGYANLSAEELAILLVDDEVEQDMILAYQRSGEGAIDAWDYCRAMQVTREAYLAGYITEEEELNQMLQTAQVMQARFGSWDEAMESYLRGYEYWQGSREAYEQRKANYEALKINTIYFHIPRNLALQKAW